MDKTTLPPVGRTLTLVVTTTARKDTGTTQMTSSKELVYCNGCDKPCRIPWKIADDLGGRYYCGSCREDGKVPEGHAQHPDTNYRP